MLRKLILSITAALVYITALPAADLADVKLEGLVVWDSFSGIVNKS